MYTVERSDWFQISKRTLKISIANFLPYLYNTNCNTTVNTVNT